MTNPPACTLHYGDCLGILECLTGLDACVTDPPYHLTNDKRGGSGEASLNLNSPAGRSRITTGFMGKAWDGGDVTFRPETWRAVCDCLRPGGYLVAFGGTRTWHRIACAIEDAGFEIRDTLCWLYGSGFPKSLDVGKAIDKTAGAEREVVAAGAAVKRMIPGADQNKVGWIKDNGREYVPQITAPATPEAVRWQGWGTALKPAFEPIILARKPLDGTVAANILRHGTGALNIDASRVDLAGDYKSKSNGRWPANVIHDGSDDVLAAFAAFGEKNGGHHPVAGGAFGKNGIYGSAGGYTQEERHADTGTAARFFYCAKAGKFDRAGSRHPTVKPIALMRWLVRLITPPGGTVLDPFAGSGTTGEAARLEGFNSVMIECETEYQADIRWRMGRRWSLRERINSEIVEAQS